jgi:hypothetical protein
MQPSLRATKEAKPMIDSSTRIRESPAPVRTPEEPNTMTENSDLGDDGYREQWQAWSTLNGRWMPTDRPDLHQRRRLVRQRWSARLRCFVTVKVLRQEGPAPRLGPLETEPMEEPTP